MLGIRMENIGERGIDPAAELHRVNKPVPQETDTRTDANNDAASREIKLLHEILATKDRQIEELNRHLEAVDEERPTTLPTTGVLQYSSIPIRSIPHTRKRRLDLLGIAGFFIGLVGLCLAVVSEFHLDDARSELRVSRKSQEQSEQIIEYLANKLDAARAVSLCKQIRQLSRWLQAVSEDISFQQRYEKTARDEYDMFDTLYQRRIVALNELNKRKQEWIEVVERVQDLQKSGLQLQGELKDAYYQLSNTFRKPPGQCI